MQMKYILNCYIKIMFNEIVQFLLSCTIYFTDIRTFDVDVEHPPDHDEEEIEVEVDQLEVS